MSKETAVMLTVFSFILNLIAFMIFSYWSSQLPPVDPAPAGNFLEWLASPFVEGYAAVASFVQGVRGMLLFLTLASLVPIVTLLGKNMRKAAVVSMYVVGALHILTFSIFNLIMLYSVAIAMTRDEDAGILTASEMRKRDSQ